MDRIEFECLRPSREIRIRVNGQPLESIAREVELPHARKEGSPDIAGSYAGLSLEQIGSQIAHFLGRPRASWFEDGDTVLMGCDCGEWGCWPLSAKVAVSDSDVIWSRFRTGHRDWDLSAIGPFRFGPQEYEQALSVLQEQAGL